MQMDATVEQKINVKAAVWTAGVHIVLLLLFLLLKYSSPAIEKPVQELGMEVNLGTSDEGSGTDQPMAVEEPAPDNASAKIAATASQANNAKEILQSDEADAPVINTPPVNNKTNNNAAATPRKPAKTNTNADNANTTRPQRPRYVYNGGTGKGGNNATTNAPGTNEGNTHGNGDRGVPGGTPGASNYSGIPGSGNGISHNLSGRSIVAFPPPDADFREGGRVVIRITVNRQGVIVNKQVRSATNSEIRAIALRKADKVRFNKSENAPEEQFGDITFVFKTRS